jgi:hypothetical protein
MNITKQKLKQIISEELEGILAEQDDQPAIKTAATQAAAQEEQDEFLKQKARFEKGLNLSKNAGVITQNKGLNIMRVRLKRMKQIASRNPTNKTIQKNLAAAQSAFLDTELKKRGIDITKPAGEDPKQTPPVTPKTQTTVPSGDAEKQVATTSTSKSTDKDKKTTKQKKSRIPKDGIRVASAPGGGVSDTSADASEGPVRIRGGQGYFHLAKALGANPRDRKLRAKLRDAVRAWNKENKGRDSSVLFTSVDYSFLRDIVSPGKTPPKLKTKALRNAAFKKGNVIRKQLKGQELRDFKTATVRMMTKFRRDYPLLAAEIPVTLQKLATRTAAFELGRADGKLDVFNVIMRDRKLKPSRKRLEKIWVRAARKVESELGSRSKENKRRELARYARELGFSERVASSE